MAEYQGHHCWNCWNVALWISNDKSLYRLAMECWERPSPTGSVSLARATRRLLMHVEGERTPDGAKYTRAAVRNALAGLRE